MGYCCYVPSALYRGASFCNNSYIFFVFLDSSWPVLWFPFCCWFIDSWRVPKLVTSQKHKQTITQTNQPQKGIHIPAFWRQQWTVVLTLTFSMHRCRVSNSWDENQHLKLWCHSALPENRGLSIARGERVQVSSCFVHGSDSTFGTVSSVMWIVDTVGHSKAEAEPAKQSSRSWAVINLYQ